MRKRHALPRETKRVRERERETTAFLVSELKSVNDNAGTFTGYVAVFNNLDGNGDVIERGAFKRTLGILRETKQKNGAQYLLPLLWQHDENEPIGGITDAYEDDHGLHISGEYDLDVPRGAQAYSGAKKGYLRGMSIGYRTIKSMSDAQHRRHLLEIQWYEGSPVTFPANEAAQLLDVKSVTGKTDWPLSDREKSWDSGAAHGRLLEWAGGKDDLDVAKFKSVHFWSPDGDDATNVSDYKFPFCDIVDGKPVAVWGAITAATGSHGIQSAKDVDVDGIKSKISSYYTKAKKQYDDDTIEVPWKADSNKRWSLAEQLQVKQLTGLAALTACATALDNTADRLAGVVDVLAASCGLSLEDGASAGSPQAPVAALLAGVPGLEAAVKAVLTSYMEFSDQTDALLDTLGLPDNDASTATDENYVSGYGYMSQLREAFELKVGRQLSTSNRDRLEAHAKILGQQFEEVKSILKDNDNPLKGENDQSADYGDLIASGKHNPSGKARRREPGDDRTTPNSAQTTPESDLLATLSEMESVAAERELSRLLS